jgi:hypothetical protein
MVRAVLLILALWALCKGAAFVFPPWRRRLLDPWLQSAALMRLGGVLAALIGAELWWLRADTTGAPRVTLIVLALWCLIGGLVWLVLPRSAMARLREWMERVTEEEPQVASLSVAALSCAVAAWLLWVSLAM